MNERVRRLPVKQSDARQLYLHSGNLCAYPGCPSALVDSRGVFIGETCHIRAAEKGGARFDPRMSNEARRAPSNLLLMCSTHHRIIDQDVQTWTVERLEATKASHEHRFRQLLTQIVASAGITDSTSTAIGAPPITLDAWAAWAGRPDPEIIEEEKRGLVALLDRLQPTTKEARDLLAIVIRRTHLHKKQPQGWWSDEDPVPLPIAELGRACPEIEDDTLYSLINELDRHGHIYVETDQDNEPQSEVPCVTPRDPPGGMKWRFILDYLEETTPAIDLHTVVADLRFDVFDTTAAPTSDSRSTETQTATSHNLP